MSPTRRDGSRARGSLLTPGGLLAVLTGCVVLGGCSGADDAEPDAGPGAQVMIESVMAQRPSTWDVGVLEDGASLAFEGSAYRLNARGWPLVSPSMDRRAAGLDPVSVEAQVSRVAGTGIYGVACAVTASTAYVFVVGLQDGRPYYAVAHLRDGVAQVLADPALTADAPDPATVLAPHGQTTRVGATCASGSAEGTADLAMTVDGRDVLRLRSDRGGVDGQVGLVAVSRSDEPLVVDVDEVLISGPG